MKKIASVFLLLVLFGCSDDDNPNNCNFLLNVNVNATINLNLPQFSQLINIGNAVKLEGQGNGGIIIIRTGSNTLRAWDGADPNVPLSSCSILTINGLTGSSSCDPINEYNLITGQIIGDNPQPCTLLQYRVDFIGNNQYVITN